jgi:hypothetical protein
MSAAARWVVLRASHQDRKLKQRHKKEAARGCLHFALVSEVDEVAHGRLTIIRLHLAIYFLPFPGESGLKSYTARIVPNYSGFEKRNDPVHVCMNRR